ncbi:MAG: DUF2490 domain-containing protein [Flavobacteriales bacterium]
MNAVLRSVVVCALIGVAGRCMAQERLRPETSQALWASAGVQGGAPRFICDFLGNPFCNRLRFAGEVGYRSTDVFFAGKQTYIDVSGRYKVSKLVSVGLEHRWAYRPDKANEQRSEVQLYLKRSWGRLLPGYRFCYQHNYADWGDQREVLRNRFDLGYDIKKWKFDPEFGVEFFSWVGNKGTSYFGTRYHLGTEWTPAKGHVIGLNLLYDRERDVAYPTYRWIWSVSYEVNLRKA